MLARFFELTHFFQHAAEVEVRQAVPRIAFNRAPVALRLRLEQAEHIRKMVHQLPRHQLAAVMMHKYQGMTYAEIGEALNRSVPAVKSLLFRAYEQLRAGLAQYA